MYAFGYLLLVSHALGEDPYVFSAPRDVEKTPQVSIAGHLDISNVLEKLEDYDGHKVEQAAKRLRDQRTQLLGIGDSDEFLELEDVTSDHTKWIDIVDKERLYRGEKEIAVILIRPTRFDIVRDEDYIKYSPKILEVFLNHDSEDCPNGGGFYDKSDFEKAIGADLFTTAMDNKYMSVKNIFAAESHGQFRPHFYILDKVMDVDFDIHECFKTSVLDCPSDFMEIIFDKLPRYCPECLEDRAPNGNEWMTDDNGARSLGIYYNGAYVSGQLTAFTSTVSEEIGTLTRISDRKKVVFHNLMISNFYMEGCHIDSYRCDDSVVVPGTTVHEMGHLVLDFQDLYDTTLKSFGMGSYDSMAYSYGYDFNKMCLKHINAKYNYGQRPPMLSAITRLWIGWSWPVTLYENKIHVLKDVYADAVDENACLAKEYTVQPTLIHNDPYLGFSDGELYAIEYRKATILEPCLPGDGGILIYHADRNSLERGNAGAPGFYGWPQKHYRVAVVQADGSYDLERIVMGNNGDDKDIHEPKEIPLDFNVMVKGKVKHMEAHEVFSSYKRFEDLAMEDTEIRDVRALSLYDAGTEIQAALVVMDGTHPNTISSRRKKEFAKSYGNYARSSIRGGDNYCLQNLVDVFEDPLLQQQCISKQLNPAVPGCLIDCLETINPALKKVCVRADGVKCDYIIPDPLPPTLFCSDFIEATDDTIWSDKKCGVQCDNYRHPSVADYCYDLISEIYEDYVPSDENEAWAAARCLVARMEKEFPQLSVCQMIEGCRDYDTCVVDK